MTFKLIAVKAIPAQLTKAVTLKRDVTISALFHSVLFSNVAFTTGMKKADAADFDTVLRQLLPIKYDKKSEGYQFNGKKAFESATALDIDLEALRARFKDGDSDDRAVVVQEFYDAVMVYYNANSDAKKSADLTADDKRMNALTRIKSGIKAAKDNGATDRDIVDMLIAAGVDVSGALVVLPKTE